MRSGLSPLSKSRSRSICQSKSRLDSFERLDHLTVRSSDLHPLEETHYVPSDDSFRFGLSPIAQFKKILLPNQLTLGQIKTKQ